MIQSRRHSVVRKIVTRKGGRMSILTDHAACAASAASAAPAASTDFARTCLRLLSFRLLVHHLHLRLAVVVTHPIYPNLGDFSNIAGQSNPAPIMCLNPVGNPAQATCSHISRPGSAASTLLPGQHFQHNLRLDPPFILVDNSQQLFRSYVAFHCPSQC